MLGKTFGDLLACAVMRQMPCRLRRLLPPHLLGLRREGAVDLVALDDCLPVRSAAYFKKSNYSQTACQLEK